MDSNLNLTHWTTRRNLISALTTLAISGSLRARSLSAQTRERSCFVSQMASTRCFSKAPLKMDFALRTSLSPQRDSSSAGTMALSTSTRRLKSPRTLTRKSLPGLLGIPRRRNQRRTPSYWCQLWKGKSGLWRWTSKRIRLSSLLRIISWWDARKWTWKDQETRRGIISLCIPSIQDRSKGLMFVSKNNW